MLVKLPAESDQVGHCGYNLESDQKHSTLDRLKNGSFVNYEDD